MKCPCFSCESCRTKLRSYRGLLTHLHTCSKVPRAKPKVTDAAPPSINTGLSSNLSPVATNQNSAPLDSRSKPQETTVQSPRSDSSVPQTHTTAAPPLAPTVLSSQDGHPEQQLPDDQDQPQTQNRFPALAPKSSPGPTVIWKKNQGKNPVTGIMRLRPRAGAVLRPAVAALSIHLKRRTLSDLVKLKMCVLCYKYVISAVIFTNIPSCLLPL